MRKIIPPLFIHKTPKEIIFSKHTLKSHIVEILRSQEEPCAFLAIYRQLIKRKIDLDTDLIYLLLKELDELDLLETTYTPKYSIPLYALKEREISTEEALFQQLQTLLNTF